MHLVMQEMVSLLVRLVLLPLEVRLTKLSMKKFHLLFDSEEIRFEKKNSMSVFWKRICSIDGDEEIILDGSGLMNVRTSLNMDGIC